MTKRFEYILKDTDHVIDKFDFDDFTDVERRIAKLRKQKFG